MRISLEEAALSLKTGAVVAVPTETVYGLAACLNQTDAVDQIFALKGRPRINPLIIHIATREDLKDYVLDYPQGFEALAAAFWPGPLTFILPVNTSRVPASVRANLPTAGFRLPEHPLTHALMKITGPLVMPSANLSGRPSSTRPEHIEQDFGNHFPVLDGGSCSRGLESTIIMHQEDEWTIIRLGALSPEMFYPILGYYPAVMQKTDNQLPLCPGQLFRHYAPQAKLYLSYEKEIQVASVVLGFKERAYPKAKQVILLGSLSKPEEVAENLYQVLRQLDEENIKEATIDMDFAHEGLWQTIRERLLRASQ